MDFNIKKPTHIFALVLIFVTLFMFIFYPILTFLGFFPSNHAVNYSHYSESVRTFFEIFLLVFQLIFVFILLIIFPLIWYFLVNKLNLEQTLDRIRLKVENLDAAIIWGVFSAIVIFGASITVGLIAKFVFGVNAEESSNIPDLEKYFSPVLLLLLGAIQPLAEEIFFRGFLLDKIESFAGQNTAIISTSCLFALAHISYSNINDLASLYPVILIIAMGMILAYSVVKTRSLLTSIIAHTLYNVVTIGLYLLFGN